MYLQQMHQNRDEPIMVFVVRLQRQAGVCNFRVECHLEVCNVTIDCSDFIICDALVCVFEEEEIRFDILSDSKQNMTSGRRPEVRRSKRKWKTLSQSFHGLQNHLNHSSLQVI